PVHRSDIDHTIGYAHGGHTRESNLAHLCRAHHTLKHHTTWRVIQKPRGVLEWTSPTGRTYPDVPTSTVMFKPEDEWNNAFAPAAAGALVEEPAPF
ncbi:MAG: HNH endonuclease, partial [Microbacteriaceae bacterium]|nr:HNH endonuclease [Microbacteriaceae bacterium]